MKFHNCSNANVYKSRKKKQNVAMNNKWDDRGHALTLFVALLTLFNTESEIMLYSVDNMPPLMFKLLRNFSVVNIFIGR